MIRVILALVVIAGSIYAACGLFTSLRDFGIGAAVAATAVVLQGMLDYVHDHEIREERERVWRRRDNR